MLHFCRVLRCKHFCWINITRPLDIVKGLSHLCADCRLSLPLLSQSRVLGKTDKSKQPENMLGPTARPLCC